MDDTIYLHAQAAPGTKPGIGDDTVGACKLNKTDNPFTFIIFGASGDLTARKLIPALLPITQGRQPAILLYDTGCGSLRNGYGKLS